MAQRVHAIRHGEYGEPIIASIGTYPFDAWNAFFEQSREGRSYLNYAQQDRIPSAQRRGYQVVEVEIRVAQKAT